MDYNESDGAGSHPSGAISEAAEQKQEEEEEEEGGGLNVERSDRQVWLVKVPGFVSKAWDQAREVANRTGEAQELGVVTMSIPSSSGGGGGGGGEEEGGKTDNGEAGASPGVGEFKLQLEESSSYVSGGAKGQKQIPLDYVLVPAVSSEALMCMHALDQGRRSLEGKVGHQFLVQPKIDKKYRQISRERMLKNATVLNKSKAIRDEKFSFGARGGIVSRGEDKGEGSSAAVQMQATNVPLPVSYVGGARYKREIGRKQTDYKRVKMESKEGLMNWIFELFRREPFWRFDAIQKVTNQPTRFLMETLKECATKVHEGEHVNKWQLKEKYRIQE